MENTLKNKLIINLERIGFKAKIVSVSGIKILRKDVTNLYNNRFLSEDFYEERLSNYKFKKPKELLNTRSIIITAHPQYFVETTFMYEGQKVKCFVPPTYSYDTDYKAIEFMSRHLAEHNYSICYANLPLKPLAVRSGLARYGRNNITYIDGWGSFFRLRAFYSDLPCDEQLDEDFMCRDECNKCKACLKICPTGAIDETRFLLRAEKCLTFLNESKNEFPGWVRHDWHHCLIGCMKCQNICPLNKKVLSKIDRKVIFDRDETNNILNKTQRRVGKECR